MTKDPPSALVHPYSSLRHTSTHPSSPLARRLRRRWGRSHAPNRTDRADSSRVGQADMVADTLAQLCAVLAELDDADSELTASATTRHRARGCSDGAGRNSSAGQGRGAKRAL